MGSLGCVETLYARQQRDFGIRHEERAYGSYFCSPLKLQLVVVRDLGKLLFGEGDSGFGDVVDLRVPVSPITKMREREGGRALPSSSFG